MTKKSAALDAINDDITTSQMEQASGGVILRPLPPGYTQRWDPVLAEAVPEMSAGDVVAPSVVAEVADGGAERDENNAKGEKAEADETSPKVKFAISSSGGKEISKDAPRIARALHIALR